MCTVPATMIHLGACHEFSVFFTVAGYKYCYMWIFAMNNVTSLPYLQLLYSYNNESA